MPAPIRKYFALALLGLLLVFSLAGTLYTNAYWQTQGTLSRILLARNPGHPDIVAAIARQTGRREGPQKALLLLTETALRGDRVTDAYLNARGSLQYLVRDWEAARQAFSRIPEHSRFARRVCVMLAYIDYNQGRTSQALKDLEAILTADPGNWDAAEALGFFYFQRKQWFEAGRVYSTAIDAGRKDRQMLEPFALAMEKLGDEHAAAGEPGKSRDAYLTSLWTMDEMPYRHRQSLAFRLKRAALLVKAEDVKGALDLFGRLEKNLETFSPDQKYRIRKDFAFFCMRFMLFKKADELFADILSAEPDKPDHIFWQANAKFKRRHLKDAEELFRQAEQGYRRQGNARGPLLVQHNLAKIDLNVRDYSRAARKFRAVINDAPEIWQARAGLAETLIRMGKFEESTMIIQELETMIPPSFFSLINLKALLAREKRHEQSLARLSD